MHDRPSAASDKAASDKVKTRVLVVGAGPVGLTLAMDLAQRGIPVTVVETRAEMQPCLIAFDGDFSQARAGAEAAQHRTAG